MGEVVIPKYAAAGQYFPSQARPEALLEYHVNTLTVTPSSMLCQYQVEHLSMIYLSDCVYVCVCVGVIVCVNVWVCPRLCLCLCVCIHAFMSVCMYVCVCVN